MYENCPLFRENSPIAGAMLLFRNDFLQYKGMTMLRYNACNTRYGLMRYAIKNRFRGRVISMLRYPVIMVNAGSVKMDTKLCSAHAREESACANGRMKLPAMYNTTRMNFARSRRYGSDSPFRPRPRRNSSKLPDSGACSAGPLGMAP